MNSYFFFFVLFKNYFFDFEEPQHQPDDSATWTLRIGTGLVLTEDWGVLEAVVGVAGEVEVTLDEVELFSVLVLFLFITVEGALDSDTWDILVGEVIVVELNTGDWFWTVVLLSGIMEGLTIGGITGSWFCSELLMFTGGGRFCWFWAWGTPKRME